MRLLASEMRAAHCAEIFGCLLVGAVQPQDPRVEGACHSSVGERMVWEHCMRAAAAPPALAVWSSCRTAIQLSLSGTAVAARDSCHCTESSFVLGSSRALCRWGRGKGWGEMHDMCAGAGVKECMCALWGQYATTQCT